MTAAFAQVVEVVLDQLAHGWSPEEIHFQHPHLSLAQIHGALTYYYEHHTELDAQIERSGREAAALAMTRRSGGGCLS